MRKLLYLLCAVVMAAFAACNSHDVESTLDDFNSMKNGEFTDSIVDLSDSIHHRLFGTLAPHSEYEWESADGRELVYEAKGWDAWVKVSAEAQTLKFRLGPDAHYYESYSNHWPLTEWDFMILGMLESNSTTIVEAIIDANDYMKNMNEVFNYDRERGELRGFWDYVYTRDMIERGEDFRYFRTNNAVFNSRDFDSAFEITVEANSSGATRAFCLIFGNSNYLVVLQECE